MFLIHAFFISVLAVNLCAQSIDEFRIGVAETDRTDLLKIAKNGAMCIDIPENKNSTETPAKPSNSVIRTAKEFLGSNYAFGKTMRRSLDCSSFTQQVFQKLGVLLPRSAQQQAFFGMKVGKNELKAGDLLFFRTYKSAPSHVGIYVGDGKMIHASYLAQKVQYDSIYKGYYKSRFLFARRLSVEDR